ncbi:MAG: Verru_Chthon cassette protein D [Chthoniobacteraceae bacterium]|nr:Verru_Chthon cassette protein D [Chthoniobacteraceae bacterium]
MKTPLPRLARRSAFSLIELLMVIAIIATVTAFVAPSFNSIIVGSDLTCAGQMIGDQMMYARQEAVTKNQEVQVRFYNLSNDATKGWRGVQVWRIEQTKTGSVAMAAGRMLLIRENVMINADAGLSPLLTADPHISGTANVPGHGAIAYAGFRFRANGATDNSITEANSFLTLQNAKAQGPVPANYYTIQVNPVTGKTTIFRP